MIIGCIGIGVVWGGVVVVVDVVGFVVVIGVVVVE